jgi:hypothetical protein
MSIIKQVRHHADRQTSSSEAGIVIEQGGLDQVIKHHQAGWASPSKQESSVVIANWKGSMRELIFKNPRLP